MQKPKNLFSYVSSILQPHGIEYEMTNVYSQYVINYFISQHKDTVKFVELLNTTKMKLSNKEHYKICFDLCPKVGWIKSNPMPKKVDTIDKIIFQRTMRSSADVIRMLNAK